MTKYAVALAALVSASAFPTTAHAWIYSGNPDLGFQLDRPEGDLVSAAVYLSKLRVTRCDGSYVDYTFNAMVDPVKGVQKNNVIGGDLCQATWYLSSTMVINGTGFVVQSDTPNLVVDLDPFDDQFALPGAYVKAGDFSGNAIQVHNWF